MASQPERVILTYEDYCQLPDDRNRYEILEGELEVTPAPSTVHQRIVGNLLFSLLDHTRKHQLGTVLTAPCDVLLSNITVVQPDLLFVARAREEIVELRYVRGAPDLVVEIVSPTTALRDVQTKRQIYARHGVANYWLIDPDRDEMTVYLLEDGEYRQVQQARANERFSAPPFPDLAMTLSELRA